MNTGSELMTCVGIGLVVYPYPKPSSEQEDRLPPESLERYVTVV